MKRILFWLLAIWMAFTASALTPNTSTGAFGQVSRRPNPDFQWSWTAQNSQAITVEFQQITGLTNVLFRLSQPERGPYYLQINNGVLTAGATSTVWQTLLPVAPSNIPPAQTLPYFAEFLGFGSNNIRRTLASGRVTVNWSIFNGTNQASFQPVNIIYTNVGAFVVSVPEQGVETNNLGSSVMALFSSEAAARAGTGAALSNQVTGLSNSLVSQLGVETAARIGTGAALSNQIAAASNALASAVSAEASARASGDSSLLASIASVSNALHAVDVAFSNQLAGISGGGTSVVQETTARIAADAALSNQITLVSNAFAAADSDTWGKFTAASNSLSTRIDAETAGRVAAVAGVSNAFVASSNSLSARIDAGVVGLSNALVAASNSLSTRIDAEVSARVGTGTSLSNNLTAASNSLSTRLDAEIAARIGTGSGLSNSLAAATNTLSTRIDTEVAARVGTGTALSNNLVAASNSLSSRITNLLAIAITNNGATVNGVALTNGAAIAITVVTNGTGNAVTNVVLSGSTLTQQRGTISGYLSSNGLDSATITEAETNWVVLTNSSLSIFVKTNYATSGSSATSGVSGLQFSNYNGVSVLSETGIISLLRGLTLADTLNADSIEIAATKHIRFLDGGGTNRVHLDATAGRLVITGAVDIVSGHAVPATINGSPIATGTPLYVQSETNANARLSSNVWAAADSTTNYVPRTGGEVRANWWFASPSGYLGLEIQDAYVRLFNPDAGLELYVGGSSPSNSLVLLGGPYVGSGSGLTGLNSGSLTNLGAGLAISGGTLTVTNTPAPLPAQTAPFALEIISRHDVHGTNLTAFYARGADAVLSLSSVTATNAVNFEGVANQSTATIVTPTYVIYNVRVPALATNFARLRWRAIDNQATANQPTLVMSWNNAASFATMTSVVSAVSTATSNGYSIAGWTNGYQGRAVQIIAAFTAASTNNLNTRFQGFEASQSQPLFTVEP